MLFWSGGGRRLGGLMFEVLGAGSCWEGFWGVVLLDLLFGRGSCGGLGEEDGGEGSWGERDCNCVFFGWV